MACVAVVVWTEHYGQSERSNGYWLGQRKNIKRKNEETQECNAVALRVRAAFISWGLKQVLSIPVKKS